MTTDVQNKRDLEEEILRVVSDSLIHLTQQVLEATVSNRFKAGRREVRKHIRTLVEKGELEYTARYGCSFIERSFNRPVRISRRVVIKPEGITYQGNSEDVVISLFKGISFGTGRHPTTSLCVRAIDLAISRYPLPQGGEFSISEPDQGFFRLWRCSWALIMPKERITISMPGLKLPGMQLSTVLEKN